MSLEGIHAVQAVLRRIAAEGREGLHPYCPVCRGQKWLDPAKDRDDSLDDSEPNGRRDA